MAASCQSATPRFRNDVGRAGFNNDGPRRACFQRLWPTHLLAQTAARYRPLRRSPRKDRAS